MPTIYVQALEIYTILGINREERENKQKLMIDYWIEADIERAMVSDAIEDCVNYRTINKAILSLVEQSDFNTIERLLGATLDCVLSFEGVLSVKVKIAKPGALRYAESVSITAEKHA